MIEVEAERIDEAGERPEPRRRRRHRRRRGVRFPSTELLAGVGETPLVVMLDGIEDPFNHGQAVRALYAAGVDGLVVRRDWESASRP
jgi:tRNA G18 (ribose-2'-O)-methylase SpoU